MRPTTFQHAELRDENDEIIQQGTYGKGSALSNSTNDGWIDYVMNNLEALNNNATPLDSPAFTGTPTAPTPSSDDDSTQIATTEFVQNIKDDEVTRADEKYLPLSGGTMTGLIRYVDNGKVFVIGKTATGNVDLCWDWANREGAGLALRNTNYSRPGEFALFARDANNDCTLTGKPDGTLTWNSQPLLPVGIVQAFAGTTIPNGWLLCDGSAVSRTDYAALYAVIGTTYGAGNGSTTFNLPNLTNRFIQGNSTSGSVKAAGLPNIKGEIGFRAFTADNLMTITSLTPGAFSQTQGNGATFSWKIDRVTNSDNQKCDTLYFDANKSNSIYSNSVNTVQPPAVTMRYIIKY